jgi:hypothetical protein
MNIPEILGASAIVVSLLFVAYELRLSNRIAIRDSRAGILNMWTEMASWQLENDSLANLMTKLMNSDAELSNEERTRAKFLAGQYLSICGMINSGHTTGLLPDEVMKLHLNIVSFNVQSYPGLFPFLLEYMDAVGVRKGTGPGTDRMFDLVSRHNSESGT